MYTIKNLLTDIMVVFLWALVIFLIVVVGCAHKRPCFRPADHAGDLKDIAAQAKYLTKREVIDKVVAQAELMEIEEEMCE